MQVIPAAECMHEVGKRHVHLTELLMPHDCTQRMQRARHQLLAAHEGPQTMQAFMWQEDLIGVAKFVTACLRKMNPSYEGQTSDQPGVAGRDVI